MNELKLFFPLVGLLGLVFAFSVYRVILSHPAGTDKMKDIAREIELGAMAFLRSEYSKLLVFILLVAVLLLFSFGWQTGLSFMTGALCSGLAGFIGMKSATKSNVRTAMAAKEKGLSGALFVAFSGGAVMGISVASLGLFGLSVVNYFFSSQGAGFTSIVTGFSMGASSIALFARIGGGIFTKAADVGADLVGKVEAGIPEDDPRNPGVIADNVGDNVGDVAGMGADIFESYVGGHGGWHYHSYYYGRNGDGQIFWGFFFAQFADGFSPCALYGGSFFLYNRCFKHKIFKKQSA